MAENKTKQTDASVDAYLAAIGNDIVVPIASC
jgi:hypothetical protein